MRHLFYLLMLLFPLTMSGEDYFTAGTEWVSVGWSTDRPDPVGVIMTDYIEECEVGGETRLGIYEYIGDNKAASELICYIRSDGDKVYFNPLNSTEWYLLYDWTLKEGDLCDVYSPWTNGIPHHRTVRCKEITETSDLTLMTMVLTDENGQDYTDERHEGTWLKGLSSELGLLRNYLFGYDGGGSILTEVRRNGKVIYSNPTAGTDRIENYEKIQVSVEGTILTVSGESETGNLTIYDSEGKLIISLSLAGKPATVELPQKGVYILTNGDYSKKVLVP